MDQALACQMEELRPLAAISNKSNVKWISSDSNSKVSKTEDFKVVVFIVERSFVSRALCCLGCCLCQSTLVFLPILAILSNATNSSNVFA